MTIVAVAVAVAAAGRLGRPRPPPATAGLPAPTASLTPVFQVPPSWRGSGMMERLTAARIELTRPDFRGAPAALALAEQIEGFSALSPARRLGAANPLAIEA
ncbi:hypothetical protein PV387_39060 [Streptomyces sp. ME02-6987-2C]|uniref:hypothetical protein n=1 Tax=unclassified Streptomyces TaxID=2593676 RepID=UPI0029A4D148|nr:MULTISPECIES: hypothetical protein [unclassified Streptomyces]MDX3371921.1 hypothetical protein [Streptomyces sp. ME02-6987-2C]MDX3427003.1 hypothetical protein [Streptomyces sp. ME02-6985-2c]